MKLIFIFIIIIILIIFIIIEFYAIKHRDNNCLNLNYWKKKNTIVHQNLLSFLNIIKTYLDKNKIIYWAHAGTLLGIFRHGNLIPWDDDIDLAVLYEEDKINNLKKDLLDNNYSINNILVGSQIYYKNIFIDLIYFYNNNDGILNQGIVGKILFPKENYTFDQVFELKYKMLDNILLPVPNKSEEYLIQVFGKDYMNEVYIHPPHPSLHSDYDDLLTYFGCNKKYKISDFYKKNENYII